MPTITLASYALVSFDLAKAYLKIPDATTSEDQLINFWINSATDELERECDRQLKSRAVTGEIQHGRGQNIILLKEWPVTAISELRIDNQRDFTAASTLVDPTDYRICDDGNGVLYTGNFPRGYGNIKVTYTAGYTTVPSDLQNACLWAVTWYHSIRNSADIGRITKNKEGETVSYSQSAPQYVKDAIARYKRTEFLGGNSPVLNM